MSRMNHLGQHIGPDLDGWEPPLPIAPTTLVGRTVTLEPIERTRHAIPLFHAYRGAPEQLWTYLPWGPFTDAAELGQLLDALAERDDQVPFASVSDNEIVGFLEYLRMSPEAGTIEIGGITWSPALQRSTASTESIFLLIDHAFANGYRRVEWKCDDLNAPSRRAALRYGFTYEGTFRKATHYKGRSRDTAWYAITNDEWPRLKMRLQTWLDPANFTQQGNQIRSLAQILVGR